MTATYTILDSGNGRKLEQFGKYITDRPCPYALWSKRSPELWKKAHGIFTRDKGNSWLKCDMPTEWTIEYFGVQCNLKPTPFGHMGLFPEHLDMLDNVSDSLPPKGSVLNLFAYTGSATMYFAHKGYNIVHVDSSKKSVMWARENCELNGLAKAPIRWITEDAQKFMGKEIRREKKYDIIILDPPTYGKGAKGEVFSLYDDIQHLLKMCSSLLSDKGVVILTSHTTELTPIGLATLIQRDAQLKPLRQGELSVRSVKETLPLGTFVIGSKSK